MGCDIHAHTEIKINGVWHHAGIPNISRSYSLFSRMADVRNSAKGSDNYDEPISQPRGLPEDISFFTRFSSDHDGADGHSHSWLSGEELDELMKWYDAKRQLWDKKDWYSWEQEELGYCFGNGWNVRKYPEDVPIGVEDARIVFWFDN